jgi:hypothetical protein
MFEDKTENNNNERAEKVIIARQLRNLRGESSNKKMFTPE